MKKLALLFVLALVIHATTSAQSCLPEGISFTTQSQINNFQNNYPNCTEIEGDVQIYCHSDNITNLDGLSVLTSIGGYLHIIFNDALTSLSGLSNVTSIGGYLGIEYNDALTSLSGLENLTSIGGHLWISNNHVMTSLSGMSNVTSIGGYLSIEFNNVLTSLSGLDNLTSIPGQLIIASNPALISLSGLENVTSVEGRFYFAGNDAITNLSGLDNVISIGENLQIRFNETLTNLSGLENVTSIGGDLAIIGNDALTSLSGLDNIDPSSITGNLFIRLNPFLSTCEVQSVCNYLVSPNGNVDISNNATGCNNQEEVLEACEFDFDIQFTPLSNMNDAKYSFGYCYDGNNIYSVCGGLGETPWKSTSIEKYDLALNTWTEIVTDLIPRRYCSAEYVPSQNKIYIFNGDTYTNTTYTDTVEIVNVQTGELSYSATNPYPVEYGGSAVWNEKIYLFGGSNSNGYSNRLYEFDPLTNNWTRLPDMPEAKQTNGEIINGVLFVFGGYSGSTSKRIDAYNIQNSSWSYLGDMPVGISTHATAKSGKYIWTVGSYDNIKHLAVYDTETNNYTQLSSNMIGRRHSGARVAGNNLYIFGGNQSGNESILNSMEHADISDIINAVDEYIDNRVILNHNYPNPFSTSTTIEYELKRPETVILTIYDYLGKQVEVIIENQPQGKQQVLWNAETYPDGIYYFRLQAGEQVVSGKMVKVR